MTDGRVSKQQDEQNPSLGPAEKAGEQGARCEYCAGQGEVYGKDGFGVPCPHCDGTGASPAASEAPAEHPWRCFHCGDVFHDAQAAEEHFGRSEYQEPVCKVDATKYREMEERVRRCNEEDTDLHRQIARMESDHRIALQREEEAGYAKGLADGRAETGSAPDDIDECFDMMGAHRPDAPDYVAPLVLPPTLEQFIAALGAYGWSAHADAQHERIAELHAHLFATPLSPKQESR